MTFEEWYHKKWQNGLSESDNAYYDLVQEFTSGDFESQSKVLEELMKKSWDARYNTLTYHDL